MRTADVHAARGHSRGHCHGRCLQPLPQLSLHPLPHAGLHTLQQLGMQYETAFLLSGYAFCLCTPCMVCCCCGWYARSNKAWDTCLQLIRLSFKCAQCYVCVSAVCSMLLLWCHCGARPATAQSAHPDCCGHAKSSPCNGPATRQCVWVEQCSAWLMSCSPICACMLRDIDDGTSSTPCKAVPAYQTNMFPVCFTDTPPGKG
jgi:hypothetical protein